MKDGFSELISLIKKSILAGLGAGVITREKAEEAVKTLVDKGRLTADEARDLVNRLIEAGSRKMEDLQEKIDEPLQNALVSANIARAKDLKELADRLEKTEQRLRMLEDRLDESPPSYS